MDMISFGSVFLELVFGHVRDAAGPGRGSLHRRVRDLLRRRGDQRERGGQRPACTAGLCTVLGDDLGSRVVIEHCAAAGVDLVPSVRVRRAAAGITVVLNFDGDRAFVTHIRPGRPASRRRSTAGARCCAGTGRAWCYLHGGARDARSSCARPASPGSKIVLDIALGDERDAATR